MTLAAFFVLNGWNSYQGLTSLVFYDLTTNPPNRLNSTAFSIFGDISKISDRYFLASSVSLSGTKIGVYDLWGGEYVF